MFTALNFGFIAIITYFLSQVNSYLAYAFLAYMTWQFALTMWEEYLNAKIIESVKRVRKDRDND